MISPSHVGLPPKFSAYRPGQDRVILDIASSDKRFSLLSARTGAGKGAISMSVGLMLNSRILYLVGTKGLQRQIHSDFEPIGMFNISGHSNYSCAETSFDDLGQVDELECRAHKGECLYRDHAVPDAVKSPSVITNYAHWVQLAKSEDGDRLGAFDLLVIDEAHTVDLLLTGFLSINLSRQSIRSQLDLTLPYVGTIDIQGWVEWCTLARERAREKYRGLRRESNSLGTVQGPIDRQTSRELNCLVRLCKELTRFIDGTRDTQWVAEKTRDGVDLKPVWIKSYAEEYLFRHIPKVILSSATLLPSDRDYLGISPDQSDYHEAESTFSHKRSPFIFLSTKPRIRVDKKITSGQRTILIKRFDSIIDLWAGKYKGIIHSRSYDHAQMILENSRHSDIMITHDSKTTREAINQYRQSDPPCIIVSPAIEEGHDFPFDACRFQIIYKVPFVYSGNPLIEARKKTDSGYVNHLAARTIVQMSGRPMRAEDDWALTFIVDAHWDWFWKRVKLPKWFRKTMIQVDSVSETERFKILDRQGYIGKQTDR